MYHFNWGWGGYCDGYYQLGALNPAPGGDGGNATSHYNMENKMIVGIQPDTVLAGTHTLTALADAPAHGSVTGGGNYSYGVREQLIFPEIVYDKIEKIRGFDICFVTTAKTDKEARSLLKLMGMPFRA